MADIVHCSAVESLSPTRLEGEADSPQPSFSCCKEFGIADAVHCSAVDKSVTNLGLRERQPHLTLASPQPSFSCCRDFGMADIVHCSAMERFAANMPRITGLDLRKNQRYPNIARWYAVMDRRPSYQKVKSDDTTLNLVIR